MENAETEQVEVRREIAVDSKRLWDVISGIGAVEKWFSGLIHTCRVDGKGVGATRHCTMADGTKLDERIVEIDPQRLSFTYTIDDNPGLPALKVRGTMQLTPLGQGRTELIWRAEYKPRKEMPGVMKKMLEEVYPMGIQSLAEYCRAN
ncbi:MAG: SRPBCC family protein [Nitrospirae bacterium]|nr:SRPBCC family protein [Nitrospirota bacterium]